MTRQILTVWIDYLSLLVVGVVVALNDTMRINDKDILTQWIDYLSLLVVGVVMDLNDTMRINDKDRYLLCGSTTSLCLLWVL